LRLKIGGVPEHFNLLWQMPYTREVFRSRGITYEWFDFSGGTGAMSEALSKGEIDVAIMLTEGAIAAIAGGEIFCIRMPFVMSPLIWGVFINAGKSDSELPALNEAKFAVSRLRSGSHLMAQFYARRESGIQLQPNQFVVSANIEGARKALADGNADYFLWEKYMTATWVESGEFQQISEVTAPWPAFVFVTRKSELIDFAFIEEALQSSLDNFYSGNIMDWIKPLFDNFGISEENARHWLNRIKYYDGNRYWPDRIAAAGILMQGNGMLSHVPKLSDLIVT
jgi:ABC-type nitrate/sulfonate/bicarbonate transport system substrate-binding protein